VIPVTLTAAGPYVQTLTDLGDQWMTEAIMCPPTQFDAVWENGRKNWLAAGAQVIIDERASKFKEPK
jgi:putative aldouronate transport system substrate-binding protein